MLEALLKTLVHEEISTLEDLAARHGVDVSLVEQMLRDLERGGYIETITMECDRGCAHCAHEGVCALVQGKRIWRVTERGFRLAARS